MSDDLLYHARAALLKYALEGLGLEAQQYGVADTGFNLDRYRALLPQGIRTSALEAILTTLHPLNLTAPQRLPVPRYLGPAPLELTREVVLGGVPGALPATFNVSAFAEDWKAIQENPLAHFDIAVEVIRKHAWAVPALNGEPGVSFYEEFKLLAALVHASCRAGWDEQPALEFTLIGGDFPGIQNAIYTITSKGAAKSLRGRSFFLQLLADGIVRALLQALQLPWINVVYVAGGNFVILAGPDAATQAENVGNQIVSRLLTTFQGNIALSLAWEVVPTGEVFDEAFKLHYQELKRKLGEAKLRPFQSQVAAHWKDVFETHGIGDDKLFCVVCHRELNKGEGYPDERETNQFWCEQCVGFKELAVDLSRKYAYLSVTDRRDDKGTHWQEMLHEITQRWYTLHNQDKGLLPTDRPLFRLNDTTFQEGKVRATGFRFVATCTPLDEDGSSIRDLEELAETAEGIQRVAILRMDVDNLGTIFSTYIDPFSLTRLSATSAAVSLFFDGWLNHICQDLERQKNRPNTLYLIYAGGDDLFIIGPWDLMPELADAIRHDLADYVNGNPYITISAGIAVIDEHFPIYHAAELAHEALDNGAKRHVIDEDHKKNAICMLGETVGWEGEWEEIVKQKEAILNLPKNMQNPLVRTVQTLYANYVETRKKTAKEGRWTRGQTYYGRWMWMQAYSLTRLGERYQASDQVRAIQKAILSPETIHLAGLAARWVEYLLRTKSQSGGR